MNLHSIFSSGSLNTLDVNNVTKCLNKNGDIIMKCVRDNTKNRIIEAGYCYSCL
jgi:hypothetical protein